MRPLGKPRPPACPILDVPEWLWSLYSYRSLLARGLTPPRELTYGRTQMLDTLATELELAAPANAEATQAALEGKAGSMAEALTGAWDGGEA